MDPEGEIQNHRSVIRGQLRPQNPAIDSDVDFKQDHCDGQDGRQADLDLLVQAILFSAPDEIHTQQHQWNYGKHREKDDIEHQRCAGSQKSVDTGVLGQLGHLMYRHFACIPYRLLCNLCRSVADRTIARFDYHRT